MNKAVPYVVANAPSRSQVGRGSGGGHTRPRKRLLYLLEKTVLVLRLLLQMSKWN